jgi:hypothetical protein
MVNPADLFENSGVSWQMSSVTADAQAETGGVCAMVLFAVKNSTAGCGLTY